MTIHKEGHKYVAVATILFILLAIGNHYLLNKDGLVFQIFYWLFQTVFFLLWFWVLWFFRIPARDFTVSDSLVISPADGKVVVIEETIETEYFKDKRLQVSIFMSPLNVHVNRSPIKGIVRLMKYHPGKFLVAWHPKSSTENERTTVVIENPKVTLLLRQVAGAVARRIRYYVKEGDAIDQNAEFGFIKFGSRVDIYFPAGTKVDVEIGQLVQGGITVLAKV